MKLRLERIKRDLTQNCLSKISGVGINTIVKIESGNIDGVSVRNLKKIAKALDITVAELFFSDDEE